MKHKTLNTKKDESEHLENNSADSHQHSDRYRYYARSNELHGINQNDRSPQYGKSGRFRSTENSGHEGSKSLRVIKDFWGQNANTLVTNRMPFDTYNLSAELRISKGIMKGQCLFMSLSQ